MWAGQRTRWRQSHSKIVELYRVTRTGAAGRSRPGRSMGAAAGGCPRYMVLRRTRDFLEEFSSSMWGSRAKNTHSETDGFARSSRNSGERTCSAERSCPLLEQEARIGPTWPCGVPCPSLRPRVFTHKMGCPGGKRARRLCRVAMLVTASRYAGLPFGASVAFGLSPHSRRIYAARLGRGASRNHAHPPCSAAAPILFLPIGWQARPTPHPHTRSPSCGCASLRSLRST